MSETLRNSRRELLKLAGVAVLGAGSEAIAGAMSSQQREIFQKPESPSAAVKLLEEGNARFLSQKLISFQEDLDILKAHTESKQEPFAAILACADSRVPVELIFDQSIGHLFVVRVAGNIATPETIASLEYAAAVLNVKAILVLGHVGCGAVKAAMAGKEVPGQISALFQYIQPALVEEHSDLTEACRHNADIQAAVLHHASPVLAGLIEKGDLAIQSGLYDVGTGKVAMHSA